jgi:hypothetical protein
MRHPSASGDHRSIFQASSHYVNKINLEVFPKPKKGLALSQWNIKQRPPPYNACFVERIPDRFCVDRNNHLTDWLSTSRAASCTVIHLCLFLKFERVTTTHCRVKTTKITKHLSSGKALRFVFRPLSLNIIFHRKS